MKTVEEIIAIYTSRTRINDRAKQRMRDVRDYYNGDVIIPLPELDSNEKSAVANLLSQGLDQTAMRIASIEIPMTYYGISEKLCNNTFVINVLDIDPAIGMPKKRYVCKKSIFLEKTDF